MIVTPEKGAKGPLRPIPVKTAPILPIIDEFNDKDATVTVILANCLFDAALEIQRI